MPGTLVKTRSTSVISTSEFQNFEGLGSSPRWTVQCYWASVRTVWDPVRVGPPRSVSVRTVLDPVRLGPPRSGPFWSRSASVRVGPPRSGPFGTRFGLGPVGPVSVQSRSVVKNGASSGNRTRATCLEGRYSNH